MSETTQKSALEIQDKIQSETKSENFFPDKKTLLKKILGFCLGLNFVSDYILQLYFVFLIRLIFWRKINVQNLDCLPYISVPDHELNNQGVVDSIIRVLGKGVVFFESTETVQTQVKIQKVLRDFL